MYYINMAQFEKCNFIPVEANHDFNGSRAKAVGLTLSHKEQLGAKFRGILSLNNNRCAPFGALTPRQAKTEYFNDDTIVKRIFGKTKNEISTATNTILTVETVERETNVNFEKVFLRQDPNVIDNLAGLFTHEDGADDNGYHHAFIIIDVDSTKAMDNLITLINPSHRVHIHVIHSVCTLADMANKRLPNSPDWANRSAAVNGNGVKMSSWLYRQPIEIEPDDIFMSGYTVGNFFNNVDNSNEINQQWTHNAFNKTIINCSDENELGKCAIYYLANDNVNARGLQNLAFQRKRSGDYFQIWFAKNFPKKIVTNPNNMWSPQPINFSLRGNNYGGAGDPFPQPLDDEIEEAIANAAAIGNNDANAAAQAYKIKWYRDRTYFMSGDWAATSYSVFSKVNTIWGLCGNGYHYTSRFKFDH